MLFYSRNLLPVLFLFISASAFANDSSSIKFIFDSSLTIRHFSIRVHDGINEHKVDIQNKQSWRGELFAPFGHISIYYATSDTGGIGKRFFFKKGDAEVNLTTTPTADQYYSIDERSSVNIIPYSKMGGAVLDSFIKKEVDAQIVFYHKYKNYFARDPSLGPKAIALSDATVSKTIEFIRRFPDLYISFWAFLTSVAKTTTISPEKTMAFYNSVFPDKFKGSKAADNLVGIIRNKIALTSYDNFPDFSAVDVNNNKIELSKLRGRYVLIQFWASWCIPCIAEIPDLKIINEKYGGAAFTLISFSVDNDLSACRKAIKNHAMNWTQVMGDKRLFGALPYASVPQVYLVDKTGRTIYNREAMKDYDLVLLKKILAEHLGK